METCSVLGQLGSILGLKDAKKLKHIGVDPEEHTAACKATGMRWIDIFKNFPSLKGKMTLELALSLLPVNYPRAYSIASSKREVGMRVDCLVGRNVFKTQDGETRKGVCSDFLNACGAPGARRISR